MKRLAVFMLVCTVLLPGAAGCAAAPATAPAEPESTQVVEIEASVQAELPAPTPTWPSSELVEIDPDWFQYTSYRLGFTIQVPRLMYRHDAGCYWNETDSDSSFRPQAGLMPVVVVEEEDRVTITSKYLVNLTEPTQIPSGAGYRTEFGGCEWLETSPEVLAQDTMTSFKWVIFVRHIEDHDDLDKLVDAAFGECYSAGEMEPRADGAVNRVRVLGDGLDVEESQCPVNFIYTVLYSEEYGTAAARYQGQSIHFPANRMGDPAYDEHMRDSFQFRPRLLPAAPVWSRFNAVKSPGMCSNRGSVRMFSGSGIRG